jgi:hypothetical protein
VARLTPPSIPVVLDQAQEALGSVPSIWSNRMPAPESLKELQKRVEEAGMEAMTFGSEDESDLDASNTKYTQKRPPAGQKRQL